MTHHKHQLVVIKPGLHDVGEGLMNEERERMVQHCGHLKQYLGKGKVVIFVQNSRCAIETAIIAQGAFQSVMFIVVDVLRTEKPHISKPKNLRKVIGFLRNYEKEFANFVLITHIGDFVKDPIFSGFFLERVLNWEAPNSFMIGTSTILEYKVNK